MAFTPYNNKQYSLLASLFLLFSCFAINIQAQVKLHRPWNNTVSAIFVFGDSTVDAGNNNYWPTPFKGNFVPYGQNFKNKEPTGRFSNGRLTTDFTASYVGIKEYVPPYLDPTLSIEDLMTGVSFASGGSGYDPLTPKIGNVIDMPTQVEHFREYKRRIESAIGKKKMERHIRKALFIVSAGTNDFVINYFTLPFRPKMYSVSEYQTFVLQNLKDFLQEIREEGARKVSVSGLPPMGCLPIVITLNSDDAFKNRGCIDSFSAVGREYNTMLQSELDSMQNSFASQGFKYTEHGCCGSGLLEAGPMCNPHTPACPDPNNYIFFDSIHPAERTYFIVFDSTIRPVIDELIKN
ncbi:hypothetical protein ACFE04_003025 [Oxalis oulophora]